MTLTTNAWEAIYRVMLLKYEEANSSMNLLTGITTEILSMSTDNFPSAFNHYLDSKSTTFQIENFRAFIQKMARTDDTWRFWVQFVFEDAMAYISLLAIRSGDWDLRVASMKSMAAVFTALIIPLIKNSP